MLDPRLGCDLVAHRDLGFCAYCPGKGFADEAIAWRSVAMEQRGVPLQPSEATRQSDEVRSVHEAGCQKDLPHSGVCYPEDEPTPESTDTTEEAP